MGLTAIFFDPSHPYFTGTAVAAGVTSGKVVSIADHHYLLDLESERFRIASVPAIRPQADTSERVGEQSLTVEGLWRRVLSSWNHGAGQHWYDRNDGDGTRFRSSRGVNPWERWELSLLPSVTELETNASGWNSLTVGEFSGGQRLVAAGGGNKCITIDLALAETTVAGLTGSVRATSTGSTVYVSDDTGIYTVNAAGTGVTLFNTNVNAADAIGFAKNRLLAGVGQQLWDVVDGVVSSPHFTNPWSGWKWTSFAEGLSVIYACGYAGDRGLIFAVPVLEDGTGLDAPRVAAELPHGEIPYAMVGYVGFLVIGTSKGVRIAQQDASGGLTMGAVVGGDQHADHLHECRCLEPQDRFVWFGWDDTFADAAGLGRVDLTEFVQPLAPAYATDLMGLQTGQVNAAVTFDDRRFFTVGTGLYREADTAVASGYVESGIVTFNISDDKVAVFADLRHEALEIGESIRIEGRTLDGSYEPLGTSDAIGSTRPTEPYALNHQRAIGHELKAVLTKGTPDSGPVLTGVVLAAQPSPARSFNVILPLLIASAENLDSTDYPMDVPAEVAYLRRVCDTQQLVRWTSGVVSHLVFVEDYEWIPHHSTIDETHFDGTMVLKLKSAELTV